jgi:hypothetical protein
MARAKAWMVRYRKELIIAATVFLISTTSFAFGYLAARDMSNTPIIIEQCSESAQR